MDSNSRLKIALASALLLSPLSASAKYTVGQQTNPMTDEVSIYAHDPRHHSQLGLRCDGGVLLMMSFSSMDHVATPNDDVDVTIRVDKNKPYKQGFVTYSNSYKDGYTPTPDLDLIRELMNGNKAIVQVRNYGELKSQFDIKLSGTGRAYQAVLDACGVKLQ